MLFPVLKRVFSPFAQLVSVHRCRLILWLDGDWTAKNHPEAS
jgi:hypothetical protein